MAINLYIRLATTQSEIERNTQHYKEAYRFRTTTEADANEHVVNYRLRHFLNVNCPNSSVAANSGLMVYDGNNQTPLTGSYNDWSTSYRPPKVGDATDFNQFNTELIMRFDVNSDMTFSNMRQDDSQAWITVPFADDNGMFTPFDVGHSFSFLGYSANNEYVKNPLNIVLEHKVAGGDVAEIYTEEDTLASGTFPIGCNDSNIDDLYKVATVVVKTQGTHNLKVGDSITLYSRSVSHTEYMAHWGRKFGKSNGERYLGDYVVTWVSNDKTLFKYQTYHNPRLINRTNHPKYRKVVDPNDNEWTLWDDLVWEKWELYEYNEPVTVSEGSSSVSFTFTGTNPVTCNHNFAVGDNVTFVYNGTNKVHMVVTSVSGDEVTAEPADGESYPSGVTSGTLVYTSRLPSSDIAFNVEHSDIAPKKVKSHTNNSLIIYACQDTFYENASNKQGTINGHVNSNAQPGSSDHDEYTMDMVHNSRYPILKFPIPSYYGEATADPNMVSQLFLYVKNPGTLSGNTVKLYEYESVRDWDESDTNRDLNDKLTSSWSGTAKGTMAEYIPPNGSVSMTLTNRYIKFEIDNEHTIHMLKDSASKTLFLNDINGTANPSSPVVFASREDLDDGHWPYIVINSAKFIGKKPSIALKDTYMYIVCDSIEKTTYGGHTAFAATVSSKVFDRTSHMWVRSWDESKPFVDREDIIEVMNTEHYNTVNAEVIGVEYGEDVVVYFRYPDGAPDIETGVLEPGIIRNRRRMISTYEATDADNEPSNLSIDGPHVYEPKYGYNEANVEFDVIHDEPLDNDDATSLNAVYSDGDVVSNTETPVIITDLSIVAKGSSGEEEGVNRFTHVGPNNSVILKGFNLNTLSDNATAILGSGEWEGGIGDGTPVKLDSIEGRPDVRVFDYGSDLNLQRSMPVYEVQNRDGATEFKILDPDTSRFPFSKSDVFAPIYTGIVANEDGELPQTIKNILDKFKYGVNCYISDNPRTDGEYVWIRLSSSYICRGDEQSTPTPILLDASEVEYLNEILSSVTVSDDNAPLLLYNTVSSVTIQDGDIDTSDYHNRLYIQIDEEPPICYVPDEVHYVGHPFPIYISDLNEIESINGYNLKDYAQSGQPFPLGEIECLLDDDDNRFIKLTLTLGRYTNLDIVDTVGNVTSIGLDVVAVDFNLVIKGIVTNGDTHTLSFKVTDVDDSCLANIKADIAGGAGVYATLGGTSVTNKITNISSISQEGDIYFFTFDLVLKDTEIKQSNGELKVFAGDTNVGEFHQSRTWQEPIVLQKSDDGCVEKGFVLQYLGVNLYNSEGKTLVLRSLPQYAFSIDSSIPTVPSNSISIKANQSGQFGVQWNPYGVSPSIKDYLNSVELTAGPKLAISEPNPRVRWVKGEPWDAPWRVDAMDGTGAPIPAENIQVSIEDSSGNDVSSTEWWNTAGIYTITYTTPTDKCGRNASDSREVLITVCNIPIILAKCQNTDENAKCVFDPYEDIEIMIRSDSPVLFNANQMNNVVQYQLDASSEPITASIRYNSNYDRKSLIIRNPGIIASNVILTVNVGEDNSACPWTDEVNFEITSKEEQDKQLDVDGKKSIVKKKNSTRSRFDDLNLEPIYNKDLSYSSFTITADENSLMQNVYSILLTNLGERLYDDEFGSTLEESVFEIIGDLNGESKLLNQCITLINKYEPRAVVVEDKSYVAINEDNTVVIVLYIKVPRGVARKIELTFRKDA